MKKLILKNKSYIKLITSFTDWLDILGFSETTVYNFPTYLQEFFYWLELNNIKSIDLITKEIVKKYYKALSQRPNEKRNGGLSNNYLNVHQAALKKFRIYLQKHQAINIPIHLKPERTNRLEIIDILTISEIKELFKAVANQNTYEYFKLRDQAILVLLYSCGLRRSEAINLDLKDILFDKELIYVRKGKNYKERLIPINYYNLQILENYIYEARPLFKAYNQSEALLIGQYGTRLTGGTMATRLQIIIKATNNETIKSKKVTPHKLRHAIATHFLQAGMKLEDIKQFLGHSCLETTQIYTHLVKKVNTK